MSIEKAMFRSAEVFGSVERAGPETNPLQAHFSLDSRPPFRLMSHWTTLGQSISGYRCDHELLPRFPTHSDDAIGIRVGVCNSRYPITIGIDQSELTMDIGVADRQYYEFSN